MLAVQDAAGKKKKKVKAKKPALTEEEKKQRDAAIVIQKHVRQLLAKQRAQALRKERDQYEKTMEQLERCISSSRTVESLGINLLLPSPHACCSLVQIPFCIAVVSEKLGSRLSKGSRNRSVSECNLSCE